MILGVDLGSLGIGVCGIALLCVGLFVLGAYLLLRLVTFFVVGGTGRTPRRRVNREVQARAYEDPFARADEDFDMALRQVQGNATPQVLNPQSMNPNVPFSAQSATYRKPSLSAGRAYAPYPSPPPSAPVNPQFPPPAANAPFPSVNPQFPPPAARPPFPAPLASPHLGASEDNPLGDLPLPPSLRDERAARRPRRDGGEEYFDEWSAGNLFDA